MRESRNSARETGSSCEKAASRPRTRQPSGPRSARNEETRPVKHIGIVACSAEGAALCYQTICREALTPRRQERSPARHARFDPDGPLASGLRRRGLRRRRRASCSSRRASSPPPAPISRSAPTTRPTSPGTTSRRRRRSRGCTSRGVVGEEAARRGFRRVGVLGTRYTMAGPVYADALGSARDRDRWCPRPRTSRPWTASSSRSSSTASSPTSRAQAYNRVIARLGERGCDAVALACTEIPLLVRAEESPLPTLDSTRLLARAAVMEALRPL